MKRRDYESADSGVKGVYVIEYLGEGICKVGITSDVEMRMSNLNVGTWCDIRLAGLIFAFKSDGMVKLENYRALSAAAVKLEKACHKKLKELGLHIRGEFFNIDSEDALAVVKKVAGLEGFRTITPHEVLKFDMSNIRDKHERAAFYSFAYSAKIAASAMSGHVD